MPESDSKKSFSTRVIVNSNKYHVQSKNWKQDWWLSNNVLYSDVVKQTNRRVNNMQTSNIVQGSKCVGNYSNVNTKGMANVRKNVPVYCGKNISPKHSQYMSKVSVVNKRGNIARGTMVIDTKSAYSRVKGSKQPQKTMVNYPGVNNGQRCESDDKSQLVDNTFVQRCDSANYNASRTSIHTEQVKGQVNHITSVNNRFWPLCNQENVNPSSHDHEHMVDVPDSHSNLNKNVSKRVNHNTKCQMTLPTHSTAALNKSYKQGTAPTPQNKAVNTVKQSDPVNGTASDPEKYTLDLRFRPRHRLRIEEAKNCRTFKLWDKQMSDKFGYIPLQDQIVPDRDITKAGITDVIKIHELVKKSETYNFLQCQIQVPSELNADVWEKYLGEYWDTQLKYLIRYGFPLDFNKNTQLSYKLGNHGSGNKYPTDIEAYLAEESEHNAILGPFQTPPIPDLHVSPFMTREKPGAPHRRVIVDLSFPAGESVNAGVDSDQYLGSKFLLTLPTIDTITNKLVKLGKGALLYKIDISRAFRHVKIDPADYKYLGLHFQDYFLDSCLPFGFRHGSAIFQRLSDAVRYIMSTKGYKVTNYIDDIIGYAVKSQAEDSFHTLYNLLQELGFKISKNKLVTPTTKATCLGVELDTEKLTIAVPEEKLHEIRQECQEWLSKKTCNRRQLQSLLGKLLYVTKCVRASRPFLNRMLDTLRAAHKQEIIAINCEFKRDINWFNTFLPRFNGVAFFSHKPIHTHVELDASLQGLGAMCGRQIYAIALPKGYQNYNIVHLEMVNILVAVRTWAHQWQGRKVVIHCDNQAVVAVLGSGHTRDMTLAAIARNINMITAFRDIELITVHIEGKLNVVADTLSRLSINPVLIGKIPDLVPGHIWVNPGANALTLDWSI